MKKLRLKNEEAVWLYALLNRGLDGYFENNPKGMRLREAIEKKLDDLLE